MTVSSNFEHSAIINCVASAESWSLLEVIATIVTTAGPGIVGCLAIRPTKVIAPLNSTAVATKIVIAEVAVLKDLSG